MRDTSKEPQQAQMRQRTATRGILPPQVMELIVPPLQVGGCTGLAGVLAGVGGSIFKETNPVLWGTISGIQWFTLGTSFWFTRTATIRAWGGEENMTLADRTKASAFSGTVAGAMGGLIRGPRNILPAMLCWTVFGAGGQMTVNHFATREVKPDDEKEGLFYRWSPLKKLSDEEYLDMMSEKLLRFDADIALIDDRIATLRAAEREEANKPNDTPSSN